MQDIEKLAKTVFENAEQMPPQEVWDGIEAKLHRNGVKPKANNRHWLWAVGVGVVVAAIVVFSVTESSKTELTASESSSMVVSSVPESGTAVLAIPDSSMAVLAVPENSSRQKDITTTNSPISEAVQEPVGSETPTTTASPVDSEEPIFDLLEYQLLSHEYDIPVDAQQSRHSESVATTRPAASAHSSGESTASKSEPTSETSEIELVIPNIVSPNGDGYNDCWRIPDLAKYGKASVQIFTAQSKRVYASDDYRGDFCGDDLPSGDYFYVLTIRQQNYTRRGVLVIKR